MLLANIAGLYAAWHGPDGLQRIAERVHRLTSILAAGLRAAGVEVVNETWFDTFVVRAPAGAAAVHERARALGLNLREIDPTSVGLSLDETTTPEVVARVWEAFGVNADVARRRQRARSMASRRRGVAIGAPLPQAVFNRFHSEHEMLRYLRRLADKDLALDRTMIPLGSCTMKLNATSEMIPITWPELADIHPFAPADQTGGYAELIGQLEGALATITGYDAVSLQPNAGSQGELAGLLAIRGFHHANGDAERDVCLIPSSAHGTNAASAVMAGMRVVVVKCDENGNVDVDDLRAKAEQAAQRLAVLMITYPSTHGVFEEEIGEICAVVHDHGGQVYVDGANLNALVGLARPGRFGADVSHLNLHKTFCIPHGGGGPGVGPVAVRQHLAPFLPGRRTGRSGERRATGLGPDPGDQLGLHRADGRRGPDGRDGERDPQRQLLGEGARSVLPRPVHRRPRPRRARVHHRPTPDHEGHRRLGRRRRQAFDGLRVPRAHDELPGDRHADGRADRERVAARARPLLRGDDRHPPRDR